MNVEQQPLPQQDQSKQSAIEIPEAPTSRGDNKTLRKGRQLGRWAATTSKSSIF